MFSARRPANPAMLGVGAAAVVAAGATLLLSVTPVVHVGWRSLPAHAAIETLASFVAGLAAILVRGRFVASRRRRDLVLFVALLCFAITNLCFATIPAAFDIEGSRFASWMSLVGRLVGAILLASCALAPNHPRRPWRLRSAVLVLLGGFGILVGAFAILAPHLPEIVSPGKAPPSQAGAHIAGPAAVVVLQAISALVFAAGAVGFTRRAEWTGDVLMGWFAIGTTLAAFASLNYVLFPSLYSPYVYTGDVLRLGFYVAILVGAMRELSAWERERARAAVLEERHRVARDLHDGLAQELAFIAGQTERLIERGADREGLQRLEAAARRALDESRAAISELSHSTDEPFATALTAIAYELEHREGAKLQVIVPRGLEPPAAAREALLRIVREAVTNAVRHGGATEIRVEVLIDRAIYVRILDNGRGFDPATVRGSFGLSSMRERASAVGAELRFDSRPGTGTEIEVMLP